MTELLKDLFNKHKPLTMCMFTQLLELEDAKTCCMSQMNMGDIYWLLFAEPEPSDLVVKCKLLSLGLFRQCGVTEVANRISENQCHLVYRQCGVT